MFLDGIRLHLCCCTPVEQLLLVRIAREGGATRYADLHPSVTHVVVRSFTHTLMLASRVLDSVSDSST